MTYKFCDNCWTVQDAGVSVNLASKKGGVLALFIFALFGIGICSCISLRPLF